MHRQPPTCLAKVLALRPGPADELPLPGAHPGRRLRRGRQRRLADRVAPAEREGLGRERPAIALDDLVDELRENRLSMCVVDLAGAGCLVAAAAAGEHEIADVHLR